VDVNIVLYRLIDQISEDRNWIRLNFFAENGDVARVDLAPADLTRLAGFLSEVSERYKTSAEAPAPGVETAPIADQAPQG